MLYESFAVHALPKFMSFGDLLAIDDENIELRQLRLTIHFSGQDERCKDALAKVRLYIFASHKGINTHLPNIALTVRCKTTCIKNNYYANIIFFVRFM